MSDLRSWAGPAALALGVLCVGWALAYPLNPNPQGVEGSFSGVGYSVNIATAQGDGSYLVNGSGFTLYFYAKDPGNGTSTCTGGCLAFWPAFYAGAQLRLPPSLSKSNFGVAARADGVKQTTYKGYPLYFYVKDKAPGQVNGQADHGFFVCCNTANSTSTSSTKG